MAQVDTSISRRFHSCLGKARRLLGRRPASQVTAAVVLPLGVASSNWICRAQFEALRRYGSNPGLEASPHVSLKLGFKVAELEPIAQYLERLSLEVAPVQLTLRGVGSFDEGIIYLGVDATPGLERLRRRILRDLMDQFGVRPGQLEGDQFKFHATLSYGLPAHAMKDEMKRLGGMRPRFEEDCRTLELWVHTGTHWFSYRRAGLMGRVAG